MQIVTANDAKQNFGHVIDQALQEPVSITKHGRPSVVITSDVEYKELMELKREHLKKEVHKGFESLDRGETSSRSAEQIAYAVLERHLDHG
jgi:prevent-host-death family protein